MYSEKLENLISIALEDGELTEQNKSLLFRKAQEEGVDLDEFEMVLNSRLKKIQKNTQPTQQYKSAKLGDVKKCPNCGAIIESFTSKCKECGYEFRNVEAVDSAKKFSEMLQNIASNDAPWDIKRHTKTTIQSFPIPTTKEDLYNFITMLQGLQHDPAYGDSYKAKYKECLIRVKSLFPNDDLFKLVMEQEKQLEQESLDKEKSKARKNKIINIVSVISAVIGIIALIGGYEEMGMGFLCGSICVFFYGKLYMLVSQMLRRLCKLEVK